MNLIVAMDKNQAIGKNNGLLVHSKKDMEYFKEMTTGKIVVMGMNTYLSLPKKFRPLPNRLNIVVTRNRTVNNDGVLVARSMEELFSILRGMDTNNVFVIGGASIYKELFPYCDKLYITRIMKEFSEAERKAISQKKQPVRRQLKIFRLGKEKELSSNSKCITESKWCKTTLHHARTTVE